MIQRRFDVSALLLLDEFIQRLAYRHRCQRLLRLLTLSHGDDLRWQIARQNHVFVAQRTRTLNRVLQLTHIAGIVVVAKNIDRLGVDLFRFAAGRARLLLEKVIRAAERLPAGRAGVESPLG